MSRVIVSGSVLVTNVETLVASMPWAPFVDVYVDPKGQANANGSRWRVYAVVGANRALIGEGFFEDKRAISETFSSRVIAKLQASGTTLDLYAVTDGLPTAGAVSAVMVGWNEDTVATSPEAVTDSHVVMQPFINFGKLANWYPRVAAIVNAGGDPKALGQVWQILATFDSVSAFAPCLVADQVLTDQDEEIIGDPTTVFVNAACDSFQLRAANNGDPAIATTGIILGLPALANTSDSSSVAPILPDTYVDAINGSDGNTGTLAKPIKTLAEVNRRLTVAPLTFTVTVHLLTDFAPSDPLNLTGVTAGDGVTLAFRGTRTTVRTGSVTAFSDVSRATNVPTKLTDAAVVDWTPDTILAGRRVRNTTPGPNLDQILYVAENIGAGQCVTDVSYQCNVDPPYPGGSPFYRLPTKGVFSPGDTYVVETVSKLSLLQSTVNAYGFVFDPLFLDLTFVIPPFAFIETINLAGSEALFSGCAFEGIVTTQQGQEDTSFTKCAFPAGLIWDDSNIRATLFSGLIMGSPFFGGGLNCFADVTLDFDVTIWRGNLTASEGHILIGSAGIFNSGLFFGTGAAVSVGINKLGPGFGGDIAMAASVVVAPFIQATAYLYGAGAASWGVSVGAGCSVSVEPTVLPNVTITGTTGDFALGLTAAKSRAFDEALGVYTAPIASTWANMAIATPAGFGGNAHNMTSEAHLLQDLHE